MYPNFYNKSFVDKENVPCTTNTNGQSFLKNFKKTLVERNKKQEFLPRISEDRTKNFINESKELLTKS